MMYLLKISLLIAAAASAYALSDTEMFTVLIERIENLEENDAANKREIVTLKTAMKDMKMDFLEREATFLAEIKDLKSKLHDKVLDGDVNEAKLALSNTPVGNDRNNHSSFSMKVAGKNGQDEANKEKRSVKVREAVETEVAFYATNTQHDVQHLGQNQIMQFDQAVTNIGNAYNPQHGTFVAPVDGTYVFHVTMMGKDVHAVTSNHFSAHIDVDGTVYSQLWIEPYTQSSQMFVVELKAGKTVSVKNHILDDGFIGQHFSSFSGFLLYQRYGSSIIGK